MSSRARELALRSAALNQQRQRLQQQKQALHDGALALCKQPGTLACAALAGFILARINPLPHVTRQTSPAGATGAPGAGSFRATLQALLLSLAPILLKQAITAGFAAREKTHRRDEPVLDR
jgi:hypothetical protein